MTPICIFDGLSFASAALVFAVGSPASAAQCIAPDVFEPNDTCSAASQIPGGSFSTTATPGQDDDFYTVDVPAGATVRFGAYSNDSGGLVDCELFLHAGASACGPSLAHDVGFFGVSVVEWTNTTGATAPVTLRLHPYTFHPPACAGVRLQVDGIPTACGGVLDDDVHPGNDDCASAATLDEGYTSDLATAYGDLDWFSVPVDPGESVIVDLLCDPAELDPFLQLSVWSSECGGSWLATVTAETTTDGAMVRWTNDTTTTRTAKVVVSAFDTPAGCALYDLSVSYVPPGSVQAMCFGDGSVTGLAGPVTCPCGNASADGEGCANSHGYGAVLTATGSTSVAADNLGFLVTQGGHGQPCLLIQGATRIGVPFKDGILCAGSPTRRLEVVMLDSAGAGSTSGSIVTEGAVVAGQRRVYQAWYRDPFVGQPCTARSNFSSAVDVLFH